MASTGMVALGLGLRWLAGLIAFVWGLIVAWALFGLPGVIVGLFIFPATLTILPLYAAFAWGAWLPLAVPVVLGIVGLVIASLGGAAAQDDVGGRA